MPGRPQPVGNPIDTGSGAKLHSETDYADASGRLSFKRRYASLSGGWQTPVPQTQDPLNRAGGSTSYAPTCRPGLMEAVVQGAVTVRSTCQPEILEYTGTAPVLMRAAHGAVIRFYDQGGGTFKPSVDSRATLKLVTDGGGTSSWLLINDDGSYESYSNDGLLRSRTTRRGEVINYSYSGGTLVGISDHTGRSIGLQYSGGQLSQLIRPDGQAISYSQPSVNQQVTGYPDGTSKTFWFGEAAHVPSDVVNGDLLTGITDERGIRYATYKYGSYGKVLQEYHAGGVAQYDFYVPAQNALRVTGPLGDQRTHNFTIDSAGNYKVSSISQPQGSGSLSTAESYTYDANYNVASHDNYSNKRECYVHDLTRNLEIVRVEGLTTSQACASYTGAGATLPAGARKTSTQYHPDWALAIKLAEPGRITTNIYNGQPDPFNGGATASCAPADALLPDGKPIAVLCKRVEQATTDANGAAGLSATLQSGVPARSWSYSYNRRGQILSEDGPRTDLNDTTTYSYYSDSTAEHTVGDLQSVTNAAGHVTQYTQYNAHGQLLQMVDGKGVTTSIAYDLRLRPVSVTVGGRTTSYSYEPTGDLKRTTQADGSWVENTYDDARRLVAVSDQLGNRIDYTLDAAGNRTGESVKDPSGALQRSISRSFDVLGRLKQSNER